MKRMPCGYGMVQTAIMQLPGLSIQAKALYALLASYTGSNEFCFPSQQKLSEDLGLHRKNIIKYLDELEINDLVERKKMFNDSRQNLKYIINFIDADPQNEPVKEQNGNTQCNAGVTLGVTETGHSKLHQSDINNSININSINTSKEVVCNSDESHSRSNSKKTSGEPLKTKFSGKEERFISYWNKKENLTTHRRNTKTFESAVKLFGLLNSGDFGKFCVVDPSYAKMNKIDDSYRTKKWSDEQIYEAIDRYDVMLDKEFGPTYKNKLTRSCVSFIFNPRTRSSLFLACAGPGREPVANKAVAVDENTLNLYKKEFFHGRKLNSVESNELVRAVNFVVQRKKEYEEKIGQYILNSPIKGNRFFDVHIKFIRARYFDAGVFDVSKILNQNIWKKFIVWVAATHKINLCPDKKEVDKARDSFDEQLQSENIYEEQRLESEKRKKNREEWMKSRKPNRFQAQAV